MIPGQIFDAIVLMWIMLVTLGHGRKKSGGFLKICRRFKILILNRWSKTRSEESIVRVNEEDEDDCGCFCDWEAKTLA